MKYTGNRTRKATVPARVLTFRGVSTRSWKSMFASWVGPPPPYQILSPEVPALVIMTPHRIFASS